MSQDSDFFKKDSLILENKQNFKPVSVFGRVI